MQRAFILSSDILPITGYCRSVLYDLTREDFEFIPNKLCIKITNMNLCEIENSCMNWLIKKEYVLSIPEKMINNFPKISIKWEFPSEILTLVVYFSSIEKSFKLILQMIEEFNIKSIFIIVDQIKKRYLSLKRILKAIDESRLEVIEIAINNPNNLNSDLISNISKLKNLLVYNSSNQEYRRGSKDGFNNIVFFKNSFENRILFLQHPSYFNVNTELFTESQKHHTYFNRKLYIGPKGEIKNAPECKETFGNINDLSKPQDILPIVQSKAFQKYWFVHKEITDVCKDCEFRHMCVDNRVPHKRKENEWYHKIECNYNPYIAKWKGEEGYRTLAECGIISDKNGFSIDHDKIATINEELWGEE